MNVHLRAVRILLIMYMHHMTSKSRNVYIYAQVVHFNSGHLPCHFMVPTTTHTLYAQHITTMQYMLLHDRCGPQGHRDIIER